MLNYNGIEFAYPNTMFHVMGPEKDPSGSDQLFTVIRLQARSLINPKLVPALAGETNPSATLARVRHMLTQPRRPLYYDLNSLPGQVGANAIINLADGRDDANGPWPDENAFSAVYTTPQTIEVTWAVTVKLRDCGAATMSRPLSLRWEDSISWDRYFKATYRRVGTLIISSRSDFDLDTWRRNNLAPRVLPGFARVSSSYTISRDGLRCDFSFVDEQLRWAPPEPAVDMEIRQSESFPTLGGNRHGEVFVTVQGHQNANVRQLTAVAVQVAKARAYAAAPLRTANGKVVGKAAVATRETRDSVEALCSVQYKVVVDQNRQLESNSVSLWGLSGSGVGVASSLFSLGRWVGGQIAPTKEGKRPDGSPIFPWVGFGTSPPSDTNPVGYMPWAARGGQVTAPADGVGLAPALKLFAALLNDPCDVALRAVLGAESGPSIRTMVSANTPAGGTGQPAAGTASKDVQLIASISYLTASQYPTDQTIYDALSLFRWDGQPAVYDFWQCLTEYIEDKGTLVLPTCNPSGTNIKVRHSSDTCRVRKRWCAMRTGGAPEIPPEDPDDDNLVLVYSYVAPREMRVAADGVSVVYEACGVYEYEALDCSKVDRNAEIPPFLSKLGLKTQSQWLEEVVTGQGVLTGSGSGTGIQGGQFGSGSGSNPLGAGTLTTPVPF